MVKNIYNFSFKTLQGKVIEMSAFKDKVLLIVNTASKCGFTPQYKDLEILHKKYKDQGLVIIGFPCNQFNGQEPGSAKEIEEGCMLNYGVSFIMADKIQVNGPDTHPIFIYLKDELSGFITKGIKWNFTKFLIDKTGKPFKRFAPITKPLSMEKDIVKLLS